MSADTEATKPPARGTPEAARWAAGMLGWPALGVTLDRVTVDGKEPSSTVTIHTGDDRTIRLTVADLFSRARFQASLAAALTYGAPLLKADTLCDVAGQLLGLATVTAGFDSLDEARNWGVAYVSTARRTAYDDRDGLDPEARGARYEVLWNLREQGRPDTPDALLPTVVLERASDSALLVVRSWFHHDVRHHLGGDRGLSAQHISSLMLAVGWQKPARGHWKVAAAEPGTRQRASLAVYVVPADWEEEVLRDALGDA